MNPTRCRFKLIDGMILVAATALGIAGGRAELAAMRTRYAWWLMDVHAVGVWVALSLALALILIRFREGWPGWARLARRPGHAACLAILVCPAMLVLGRLVEKLVLWTTMGQPFWIGPADVHQRIVPTLTLVTPCAVAAAWAVLALGGRWRPARDGIDRLGILLGLYWISWDVVASLLMLGV